MKGLSSFIIPLIMVALVFSIGCSRKSNVTREGSKTITVTMTNNGAVAVHIYQEGESASANNLLAPGGSRTSSFLATRVGHSVSFYVKDPNSAAQPSTIICSVGQTAWDTQNSAVTWDGQALHCTTW